MKTTSLHIPVAMLLAGSLASQAAAQSGYDPSCGYSNMVQEPSCGYAPCPAPEAPRSAPAPEAPRSAPAPNLPPIAPGAYAAPPRSGVTMGEQRGRQLGGLRLRIPELVIGLPQIEFLSCTQFTRSSHMRLDEATAPYVANPYYAQAVAQRDLELRQYQLQEEERARKEAADQKRAAEGEGELERLKERERELTEQLESMNEQLRGLQSRMAQPPSVCPCPTPCPTICPTPCPTPCPPQARPVETLPCPMPESSAVPSWNRTSAHGGQPAQDAQLGVSQDLAITYLSSQANQGQFAVPFTNVTVHDQPVGSQSSLPASSFAPVQTAAAPLNPHDASLQQITFTEQAAPAPAASAAAVDEQAEEPQEVEEGRGVAGTAKAVAGFTKGAMLKVVSGANSAGKKIMSPIRRLTSAGRSAEAPAEAAAQ